jgi:adenylate kinase
VPLRLILVGPPGVGKGTQAALMEERLGVKPLSSGVIFRAEIEADTDLGQLAKSYIDRGELVPNGVTIQMMLKRLRSDEVRKKGFVLDGFPRTVRQAEALDVELETEDVSLDCVILLVVDDEVVVRRLAGRMGCTKCGEIYHSSNKPPRREGLCDKCNSQLLVRKDDNPETIRERLRVFREETAPVAEYYRAKGLLREVDAAGDAEEVYAEVTKGLPS